MKEATEMIIADSIKYTIPLKRTVRETERLPLHDPIDGESLCEKIAELLDAALGALHNSANENGVEIIDTRIAFVSDREDLRRPSGCFRVIATGKEKEEAK